MKDRSRDRSLQLLVRQIQEPGEHLEVELSEAELGAILSAAEGGYRTVGRGAKASFELSRAAENVFLRGRVRVDVGFDCSRCTAELTDRLDLALRWSFLPASHFAAADESDAEVELTSDDLDVSFYEGETIDLAAVIREALLLELSPYPTCPTECELERTDSDEEAAAVDPRWLPLLDLKRRQRS